jgi:hypothetical protein
LVVSATKTFPVDGSIAIACGWLNWPGAGPKPPKRKSKR